MTAYDHHCAECYAAALTKANGDAKRAIAKFYAPLNYDERPGTDTTSPAAVYICPEGHSMPFAECKTDPTAPPAPSTTQEGA